MGFNSTKYCFQLGGSRGLAARSSMTRDVDVITISHVEKTSHGSLKMGGHPSDFGAALSPRKATLYNNRNKERASSFWVLLPFQPGRSLPVKSQALFLP